MKARLAIILLLLSLFPFSKGLAEEIKVTSKQKLSYFDLNTGGGEIYDLALREGKILYAFRQGDHGVLRLCDAEGKILKDREISPAPEQCRTGFLKDGLCYILIENKACALIYDLDLREVSRICLPAVEYLNQGYLLSSDGKRLWCFSFEKRELLGFGPKGEEVIVSAMPLNENWYPRGFVGADASGLQFVMGKDEDHVLVHYDITAGKSSFIPLISPLWSCDRGLSYYAAKDELYLEKFDEPGRILRLRGLTEGENPLQYDSGYLLSGAFNAEARVTRYLCRELGGACSEIQIRFTREAQNMDRICLDGKGRALIPVCLDENKGSYRFYLWDMKQGEAAAKEDWAQISLDDLADDNQALIREMEAQNPVRVKVKDDSRKIDNDFYKAHAEINDFQIRRALKELSAFLQSLPRGMVKQALVPPFEKLDFYLTGGLYQSGPRGISDPAGFASDHNGRRMIVLDIRASGFKTNLAHEFMHFLEDKLIWKGEQDGLDYLESWNRLFPLKEDEGYYFSYQIDTLGDAENRYTPYDLLAEQDKSRVLYLDAYSRTYPLEDRARIFENLFCAEEGEGLLFRFPRLNQKARYLCALLRLAFPGMEAVPPWECFISPLPKEDWPKASGEPRGQKIALKMYSA